MVIKQVRGMLRGAAAVAVVAGVSITLAAGVVRSAADTGAVVSGGTWGTAQEVPGTAALNTGGDAVADSVSCVSAGNCAAGGWYAGGSGEQAFVADERSGTWGTARELPGLAALNQGGAAAVMWVSCAVAGDCAAAGYYTDSSRRQQALVASEVNGTWQKAIEVPGLAALNRGRVAQANSVSCASAGNCAAGGSYISSGDGRAFVASEVNGIWHAAIQVPGTAALNQGGGARVDSVSCASAGDCAAGGVYTDGSGHAQAFVASEVNGIWQKAIEVPGTAALNQGGHAGINSVSCASAGNCAAGGWYADGSGHAQALVASEVNAIWDAARELPGTAALNRGGRAGISSVSCPSAGNCGAAGGYTDSPGHEQAFVASEVNGLWQTAIEVPGTAALNQGGHAGAFSVSCASAGNCGAGGDYADSSGHAQAFVVNQTTRT